VLSARFVRLEGEINAIATDPVFKNGDYTTPPTKGIEALPWSGRPALPQECGAKNCGAKAQTGTTFDQVLTNTAPTSSRRRCQRPNPQMRTWERHDVGATPGFTETSSAPTCDQGPYLYMPSETDLYFPLTDAPYEAAFIPRSCSSPIPPSGPHRRRRPEPSRRQIS